MRVCDIKVGTRYEPVAPNFRGERPIVLVTGRTKPGARVGLIQYLIEDLNVGTGDTPARFARLYRPVVTSCE